MKSALILTQITNLELDDIQQEEEWELMPGLFLSTSQERMQGFLTDPILDAIGGMTAAHLNSSQHFVYALFEDEDIDEMFPNTRHTPEITRLLLDLVLNWLRNFLRASWFIKDNCMSCEEGYSFYPHEGCPNYASANSLHELNITCYGQKQEQCRLNHAQMAELIALHDRVETALFACRGQHGDGYLGKHARLVRCFDFLQCARTSYSIPLRMAHYCSALEALFGTSSVELTHRLSERVALFFSSDLEERVRVYTAVKDAYALRSQVIHGDSISKRMTTKVHDMCAEMDGLLRLLLRRIVEDDQLLALVSGSNEEIDRCFLNQLMGGMGAAKTFSDDLTEPPGSPGGSSPKFPCDASP